MTMANGFSSLETLGTSIAQQNALLARTQTDLEILPRLKSETVADVGTSAVADVGKRNKPNLIPCSGLSDLQIFVREARKKILDPVLGAFRDDDKAQRKTRRRTAATVAPAFVDHADDANTTAVGSGSAPSWTRCRSPPSPTPDDAAEGEAELPLALAKPVRVRRISTKLQFQNQERSVAPIATRTRRRMLTQVLVQTQETQPSQPQPQPQPQTQTQPRISKPKPLTLTIPATRAGPVPANANGAAPEPKRLLRKPKTPISKTEPKAERGSEPPSPFDAEATDSDQDATPEPEPEPDEVPSPSPPPPSVLGKRQRRREAKSNKLKPDTHKVMWSGSEQSLLERLLEEIPVGDTRRYVKISRAMDGRRTPKQVSNRVQKYMQKLRRSGLGG